MAEKLLHKGQSVYAADGTYLGLLLQCDARFMVVGSRRWGPDHWIVPNEEVAAAAPDIVILRTIPAALHLETAEPWWPPSDHIGNADGVDVEPLRAGMAEVEDKSVGTRRHASGDPSSNADDPPRPPLPSPDDVIGLDRERIERLDAQVERLIAAEIEDLELGAACARPAGMAAGPRERAAFVRDALEPVPWPAETTPRPIASPPQRAGQVPAEPRVLTGAGAEASRTPETFELVLCAVGFSVVEAQAIATGGFRGLRTLHRAQGAPETVGPIPGSARVSK
jgi:hypothetical protein